MPEFYMIHARKISKIPDFYMIFWPKSARILHNNCPKNISSTSWFFWRKARALPAPRLLRLCRGAMGGHGYSGRHVPTQRGHVFTQPRPRWVLEFAKIWRVFLGRGLVVSNVLYCLENVFVSCRLFHSLVSGPFRGLAPAPHRDSAHVHLNGNLRPPDSRAQSTSKPMATPLQSRHSELMFMNPWWRLSPAGIVTQSLTSSTTCRLCLPQHTRTHIRIYGQISLLRSDVTTVFRRINRWLFSEKYV